MEAAKNRLWHAKNYLEKEDTHHMAYEEFKEVLSLAEKAYPKVESFKDKIFCKQLGIFSRVMSSTYDVETRKFVPLYILSPDKKHAIAKSVFHDVEVSLQDFKSIEVPWSKAVLGKTKKHEQKNQDILDTLLKSSLSVFWSYQELFIGLDQNNLINFSLKALMMLQS